MQTSLPKNAERLIPALTILVSTGSTRRPTIASLPAQPPGLALLPAGDSDEETHAFVADVMIAQRETWLAWEDVTALGLLVLDGFEVDWLFVDPVAPEMIP